MPRSSYDNEDPDNENGAGGCLAVFYALSLLVLAGAFTTGITFIIVWVLHFLRG